MARVVYDRLWCSGGSHQWDRIQKRGRTPRNCPEHDPKLKPRETPSAPLPRKARKGPSDGHRRPKTPPIMVEEPPENLEPVWRSKGVYLWLSNDDISFLKRKLRTDGSESATRIKQELC